MQPAITGSQAAAPEPELHHSEHHPQVVSVTGAQAASVVEQRCLEELALLVI